MLIRNGECSLIELIMKIENITVGMRLQCYDSNLTALVNVLEVDPCDELVLVEHLQSKHREHVSPQQLRKLVKKKIEKYWMRTPKTGLSFCACSCAERCTDRDSRGCILVKECK